MAYEEIPLYGGAYQARSLIAAAQEAINVYPEINPEGSQAPTPVTNYLTPGLLPLIDAPAVSPVRCLYRASDGTGFTVIGDTLYSLDTNFNLSVVGAIPFSTAPVSMNDNGIVAFLVDGTATGYVIDLDTLAFSSVGLVEGFIGADKVVVLDTFFLFNVPGTNAFYSSLSNVDYAQVTGGTAFDPLDIAAKTNRPDPIVTMDVVNGDVWIIGAYTSEAWNLIGGAGFPFARIPGAVINHGCSATFGEAQADTSLFWLMRDNQGEGMIVQSSGYGVTRVSTHAMEQAIQHYSLISDCIMFTRQEDGHYFLVVIFPTADVTWEMDIQSRQWHKWLSYDNNGVGHRNRSNCFMEFAGKNVVGDYQNGKLYDLDHATFTDDGNPIVRERSFPVVVAFGHNTKYQSLVLDIQPGLIEDDSDPMVDLLISDDGGKTFPITLQQSLGLAGEYSKNLKYGPPLGMARYRVYKVRWSAAVNTSINRAFSKQKTMPW